MIYRFKPRHFDLLNRRALCLPKKVRLSPTKKTSFLVAVIFGVVFLTPPLSAFASTNDKGQEGVVTKIVDGDTLLVRFGNGVESIRLLGIDTPESRKNPKAHRDAIRTKNDLNTLVTLGKQAESFVHSLIKVGDPVSLEFDVELRDKYGRILAYVFLRDGTMLNEKIVASGFGTLMTYPPNVKYAGRFRKALNYARDNKLGLWQDELTRAH